MDSGEVFFHGGSCVYKYLGWLSRLWDWLGAMGWGEIVVGGFGLGVTTAMVVYNSFLFDSYVNSFKLRDGLID